MTVLPGRLAPFFPIPPLSTSVNVPLRLLRLPSASASVSVSVSEPESESAAAPHPNRPSFSPEYLIQSCGLSSDEAAQAYKKIQHLKSPDKPDAVLRFLRDIGISESDISRTISRDARILCSSVDKNLRPNVTKLQQVGLSIHDISYILLRNPDLFKFNFVPKIDFWLGVLGSAQNFSVVLRRFGNVLGFNVEKSILPNLCFLKDHCGFSSSQIVQLLKTDPRVIACNTEALKMKAQRADKLGVPRSSGMFVYALIVISRMTQHTVDARLNNLKSLGFSQEQVNHMVSKNPLLLGIPEKLVSSKMEFLLKEAGCDKTVIVRNTSMLMCSLENRLIPRNLVRKLLMSKGLPASNNSFGTFATMGEKGFVEKYILPYEHDIPGLYQAYADACAEKEQGKS